MTVQVLLLAAGLGSRFAVAGYSGSKALVDVAGRPMFAWALDGLADLDAEVTAVVRAAQVDEEGIDDAVRRVVPDADVVVLPGLTRGAAESAALGAASLKGDQPVVVLDCDLTFSSREYLELCRRAGSQGGIDCGLLTFTADDPRYSYARSGAAGAVVEVAEKRVISDRAIAGAYLFGRASAFRSAADSVLRRAVDERTAEYYMSAVVAEILQDGGSVLAADVDHYLSFGTPEELAHSLATVHA